MEQVLKKEKQIQAKPIMKWAGGKTQMLGDIMPKIPQKYGKYIEPFIGGGALFFALSPDKSIIADSNPELINMYRQVADNVEAVISYLKKYKNTKEDFYEVRSLDWLKLKKEEAAARTIYLNKTCFNGLYRVNKKGQFNVPFGKYKAPNFCDEEALFAASDIGLILDYAQELSIIQGERITLNILNEASKRFYKERLVQFFEESKTAKMTYNERIESLELNKLLNQIIDKEKTIKTNIRTNQYTAVIFQKERNNPYTSHFYIAQELEPYLGSLELNFFISKYNEMSNKSGKKVSIYALNYGLCMDENLRWGKPKGNEYRTYFIESPFNFTPVIKNFLSENKKIYCENCMHEFSEEEYNLMKKYGGTCLKCGCKNSIQEKRVLSDEERSEIEEIEKKDNLLEREQYQLLKLLQYSRKDKTATELAQELDVSWQKIGWIAKKIEEDYCYLKKEPRKGKMYYVLSDLGREYLDSITP